MKANESAEATRPVAAASLNWSPAFLAVRDRWRDIDGRMKTLNHQRDALNTALGVSSMPRPLPEHCKSVVEELGPDLMKKVERNPRRAMLESENTLENIIDLQQEHQEAYREFATAQSDEAARIAAAFMPEHAAAIADMVAAIEALNRGMEAERDVHRRFAAASPLPASHLLPDASGDFREMDLAFRDGTASRWAREVRAKGLAR